MKFFWKIYSAVFICFVLIVTAMSVFIIKSQIANATESMINQQKTVGSIMIDELEKGYLVDKMPFQSLKSLTEHKSFGFWWLVKPSGEVYLADDIKSIGIRAFTCFPQASRSLGDNAISITGNNEIVFIQKFGYGSNKMSFWLGFTTKDIQLAKNKIISTTITFAFVSLAVLGLMIYFVINHLIMPIRKLTVAAGKIGSGQFDCEVDKQSNDEIGLLADAFNKMIADLKQTTTSIDNLNREISDRNKAEEKINTSQKLLHRIINLLPLRVFWKDKNLKFLGCNEIFAKDAGENRPEDLIGKDDFQTSLKEQAKNYQDEDKSVITSGKSMLYIEERQITPKGDKILLKTNKVPLTDLQGNIIGILGTYEDITDRKQAEDALGKSEKRFRAIFNSTFQFTGLMTLDGTLVEANQSAIDYAGLKLEDVINRPFWETHWWKGNKERVQKLKESIRLAASGEFVRYEVELHGTGDTMDIFDFSIKPVFGPDGKVTFLVPEGRNITEHKKAEKLLLESEERYRILFESSIEGIGLSKGNQVINANPALLEIFGYDNLEEFLKVPLLEHVAPESRSFIDDNQRKMQRGESIDNRFEYRIIRKDGQTRDLEILIKHIQIGNDTYAQSTFRDITERKQSEIKLLEINR